MAKRATRKRTPTNSRSSGAVNNGILVTGDFIVDLHIYEGERREYADTTPGVLVKSEVGGAGKLAELIDALLSKGDQLSLKKVREVTAARISPTDATKILTGNACATQIDNHAYAFWRRRPEGEPRDKQRWRCVEAMGFGSTLPNIAGSVLAASANPSCAVWPEPTTLPKRPAIVVISEGGMGFRDNEKCWQTEALEHADQIVFKTANQPTKSKVWEVLKQHAEKLTIVISASELRRTNARISAGLTWEETFRDLLRELGAAGSQSSLYELTNCRNLVVTFDNEAAVAIQMVKPMSLKDAKVNFSFRPSTIENDAKIDTQGTAFGFLTCFTASIVRAIAMGVAADEFPNLESALSEGLSAMSDLLSEGHGLGTETPGGFPIERIVKAILNPKMHFTTATFLFSELAKNWTFLQLAEPTATNKDHAAFKLATLVAIHGPVAIANLPHLQIGDLITVDDEEVTALRNLRRVIRLYVKEKEKGQKPLSIGVFGPPGAGKSYAVKQIANNLLKENSEWLEFNLSQFEGPTDLIGAFHQIRDHVLQGKVPVAFFDEFDSRKYLWLQYLLAPMQDGKFQEGELTHTVGKCIFVFAGGTSWTYDTFGPPEQSLSSQEHSRSEQDMLEFRLAKGPDFLSRLDAYFNVVGPNPRVREFKGNARDLKKVQPLKVGGRIMVEDERDIWWPIRRALMLRSKLKLKPDQQLKIDRGLLKAILQVPKYRHGSRSLEKILLPLMAANTYQPSFVPHRDQLELHTMADDFLRLLDERVEDDQLDDNNLTPHQLKKIADGVHDTWNHIMVRTGNLESRNAKILDEAKKDWTDKKQKVEKERDDLASRKEDHCKQDDELKSINAQLTKLDSNTGAAERMSRILALVNLKLDTTGSDWNDKDQMTIQRRLAFLKELLASEEHRGWMEWYFERGWKFAPKRNDADMKHNLLIPFSELPEAEKDKDRQSITNYLEFAKSAGLKIVPKN